MDRRYMAHRGLLWMLPAMLGALSLAAFAEMMRIPLPSPGLMPNPAVGKALYGQKCASCHGADLKGSDKGPPFLHRIYEPSHHSDLV